MILGLGGYLVYSYTQAKQPSAVVEKKPTQSPTSKTPSEKKSPESKTPSTTVPTTKDYVNDRFGFKAPYPSDWTIAESQNGDGATLTSPNTKATIRVYGFTTDQPTSLEELYRTVEDAQRAETPDLKVTATKETVINDHPALEAFWSYDTMQARVTVTGKGESGIVIHYAAPTSDYETYSSVYAAMVAGFTLK